MTYDSSLPPTVNFSLQQKTGDDRTVSVFPEQRAKEASKPIPVTDRRISQAPDIKVQIPVAPEKNKPSSLIAAITPVKQLEVDSDKPLVTSRQIDENIPAKQSSLKVYAPVQTKDAAGPE